MLKNRAIILAAGSSTRMGSQKMLLPFGESTILETVIHNIALIVGGQHPGGSGCRP